MPPERERRTVRPADRDIARRRRAGGLHLRIVLSPDFHAVRDALADALEALRYLHLTEDERGTFEIVLAEALNNVVEHVPEADEIEVRIHGTGRRLRCMVTDDGTPLRCDPRPDPGPPQPWEPREGGFGCFLIDALAQDVRYAFIAGRNRLSFQIGLDAAPALH